MGRLLITLVFVFASSHALAEWTHLDQSTDGSIVYYVEKGTVRKGPPPKGWFLIDFPFPSNYNQQASQSGKSVRELIEADCRNERTRLLSITGFSENMGQGIPVVHHSAQGEWIYAGPRTITESIFKTLCGRKP